MQQGYVVIKVVKVLVVGPAGVGKTCLLYLLLGRDPPDTRTSTGCAERAIRVIRIAQESGEWSEISTKEFEEIIAEAVPVLCQELQAKEKETTGKQATASAEESQPLGTVSKVMQTLSKFISGKLFTKNVSGNEMKQEQKQPQDDKEGAMWKEGGWEMGVIQKGKAEEGTRERKYEEESKVAISKVTEKLTELVSTRKGSHRLLDMDLIYMNDCGGQQAYWDLLPVFTYDTSATLFVHRLCEKLDEHPLNDLYQRGKQVGPSQRATLTTAEAFKTMLQGLHKEDKCSVDTQQDMAIVGEETPKKKNKCSRIIAIGTHKDLAGDCEETPEEKSKRFAAIASPHFKDDIVYCNEGLEQIVFQVNTKNPGIDDKKEATKIRTCIEKGATEHKIPIWWFIFQLILESLAIKLGREVLSKKEVLHVSETLGFSEGELDAALTFFDKLNIFLYKKTILPGVVFTNVQVPLDKLSKLVEKQYHLRAAMTDPSKAADHAMSGDWQKFRDNGILTLDFLEEFNDHYVEGIFTANDFLVLLEKLLVISPLSITEYFLPAILNMASEAKIKACLESSKITKIAVMVIEFPTRWAPPGVYCCAVCHLQSHSKWMVVNKRSSTNTSRVHPGHEEVKPPSKGTDTCCAKHPSISRNCVEFTKVGRPGSVAFIDNFSSFAVCYNVNTSKMPRDQLVKYCQDIKSKIFAAVEAALRNTHDEETHPTMAFLCPRQDECCSTELHVAHLSSSGQQWVCSENSGVFDTLTPDQTLWLSASGK